MVNTMPPEPTLWLDYLERLVGAGAATLFGMALVASYFKVWGWTPQHKEQIAELKAQHAELIEQYEIRIADLVKQNAELKTSEQRWVGTTMELLNPVVRAVDDRLTRKGG